MTNLRFGIAGLSSLTSLDDLTDVIRRGEAAGFTSTLDLTRDRVEWATSAAAGAGRTIELQMRVHVAVVADTEERDRLVDFLPERMGLTTEQLTS